MALRDQAKNRAGRSSSKGSLATKARSSSKPRPVKLDTPEPEAAKGPPPYTPPSAPPLPPALGFITSYARIPGLRKDKNTQS